VESELSNLEFREVLANLAKKTNCSSYDIDIWELLLTHESYAHEQGNARYVEASDERAAAPLLQVIQSIGRSGVQLAIYEYCLDIKGMDTVETSRCATYLGLISEHIADEFELISAVRVGKALKDSKATDTLKQSFADRFLGGVLISSSYENLRSIVWRTFEAALFTSSGTLSYANLDPKSWLQEYAQRFFRGRKHTYRLISERGPDHSKQFEVGVTLPDGKAATAIGKTIKDAEKLAAAVLIKRFQLEKQLLGQKNTVVNSSDWEATGRHYLDVSAGEIDGRLLRSASVLRERLKLGALSTRHLAVAMALPSSRNQQPLSNSRHKLLGDGLEILAFSLFAFEQLPTRTFASKNIHHLAALMCSQSNHTWLFDHLGLGKLVLTAPGFLFSEQTKADVVKAVNGSIYLSSRDFSHYYRLISDALGTWGRNAVAMLTENVLEMNDPKTLLQELLQGQKQYHAEYTGNSQTGPAHMPIFSTTLFVRTTTASLLAVRGTGQTLKAAQQAAALSTLKELLPVQDGEAHSPTANRFWKHYFDRLLAGEPGTLVGICGVDHFRMLNSVAAHRDLMAFRKAYPNLCSYLDNPDFIRIIVRSIGKLPVGTPSDALRVAKKGIALVTARSPDDTDGFTSPGVEVWLDEFRKASAGLKLPTKHLDSALGARHLADLRAVREWQLVVPESDSFSVSEAMFSHVLTLLELLEDDSLPPGRTITIVPEINKIDCRSLTLHLDKSWSRVHLEQLIERLSPNAFFSGVYDSIGTEAATLKVQVKGAYWKGGEDVYAYLEILKYFYQGQDHLRSLYRIVHDLKNQIIAVRNYALRAKEDPSSKYRMFVAIEALQNEIREREVALGVYFRAADELIPTALNVQQLVRDFMTKRIPLLPEQIRASFTDNLEHAHVLANKDLLMSLLENLTKNAIEAMPKGGRLSISMSYKLLDSVLEIEIADTGIGIAPDVLPDLFTSLRSTKRTGMGLGLATVKAIVEQHDGLIDVKSAPGEGTKFTVLLPLKKVSEAGDASISR
jgi:signal transduction histidine kinase/dsRNA-specific ribonuclease